MPAWTAAVGFSSGPSLQGGGLDCQVYRPVAVPRPALTAAGARGRPSPPAGSVSEASVPSLQGAGGAWQGSVVLPVLRAGCLMFEHFLYFSWQVMGENQH